MLLGRVHAALVLRGSFIMQGELFEDCEGSYPAEQARLFAVRRLLCAEQGSIYSRGETGEWLQDAEFVKGPAA